MADEAILPVSIASGTVLLVREPDDEATKLTLEALFDIRAMVFDIYRALFGDDDEEEETEEDT